MTPFLEVKDIGKSYGAIKAVDDLQGLVKSLKPGDYVSFMVFSPGPNGGNRVVNLRVGE